LLFSFCANLSGQVAGYTVRFHTNLGDIDVNLTPDITPLTVANFLNYLSKGAYTNSIFHRSVPGFIIQGGGYQLVNHAPAATAQGAAVRNEFKISNTRGTIAMAKLGTDPNSATNQWFFNLANNASNLDNQNGGFTVFGRVANAAGLAVMDKIAAIPVYNAGSPFDQIPLYNYKSGTVQDSNFVLVSSIERLPLVVTTSFASAASYQDSSSVGISPGELVVVFGQGIGAATMTTLSLDSNGAVSTSLAGTRVLFDGTPAPVIYTSTNQIGVVAPYNLAGKSSVSVVVEKQGSQISSASLTVVPANPGIFTLDATGKGDGAIVRLDGSPVTTAAPAQVGDTLLLFGEGYGTAAPGLSDGAIVGSIPPVPAAKTSLLIDGQPVSILYAGGVPQLVNGVLQVNFQVPQLAAGSHMIQLLVGDRLSPAGVNFQTR
jgi:uncharacterized protein (TIGR03437 family)